MAFIDLLGLYVKDLAWYQMALRSVIVFVMALVFIRIAGMRSFGTHSAFDVVLSITIGGILSRCITGHYPFFPALLAACVLALMHRLTSFLSYKSHLLSRLSQGRAILLFSGGRRIEKHIAKHSITHTDLLQALHEKGLETFDDIQSIWLEPDGKISIIKKQQHHEKDDQQAG